MGRLNRPAGALAAALAVVLLSGNAFARHAVKRRKHVERERPVAATRGGLPNVQAQAALVIDEGGRAVFAKNADKERPIASISKLAATLVVAEKGVELEGLSTINKNDIEVAKGGARSRLFEGMTLSNRDLLHSALMGSDNRAIPALGRSVKLTPAQLTTAMNAKAHALGLKSTRFHEPTGLSTGNVSTPREIIALLRAVMANPTLAAITRRAEYDAHPVGKPPIHYNNTNHPAARGNVQVLGGKTGYNDEARYCLVVATKIDGRNYYMAFLGDDGKMTRFGDVARVADWIISHPQKLSPGARVASMTTSAPASAAASTSASPAAPPLVPAGPAAPPIPVVPRSAQEPIAAAPATPPAPLPVDVAAPPPPAPDSPAATVATP
ncbi:MAG TPA: serine hydrolase [Polyangia bacterium]|jgi:D-alanyl-D-alanine endopeptidase (penicillin-binding protein 7)|nr:serine hydrolase [Polyangia bacterium]